MSSLLVLVAGCSDLRWNTAPTRTTHAQYFPIEKDPHAVDCNTCHSAFDSFTQFDCLNGCHTKSETDPNHNGVPGYSYDSPSCYSCHPTGTASDVNHTPFFPIADGDKHAGVACGSCHQDPGNRDHVTCADATCHPQADSDGKHGAVGGYQYDSPTCLRCHADSQVDRVASHGPFPISRGHHFGQSCLICHPNRRSDKPYGEDFASFTCISSCHTQSRTDAEHAGRNGYASDPMTCLGCHPTGSGD